VSTDGGSLAGATALAADIAAGRIAPLEAVDAAIARIEAVNPRLNAVIHERFDRARREAAAGPPCGAFRGVPVLLKDLGAASAGDPQHAGLRAAKAAGWLADHDAAVVVRLRSAGFVVLGRTNTPELGTTITTEPLAYGPTRNPWDPRRSAGGSSGGSAAAVASGMVPVAHASDGGGSIRIPAANCGLVGLKPSRGRVSRAPDKGEAWMGGSTDGALARSVSDAAALLDVLAGTEPGDPYSAPPLPGPLAGEVGLPPGRLRIGVLDHPPAVQAGADAASSAAARHAGEVLSGLGHEVEASYPAALEEDEEYRRRFLTVVACGVAADLAGWEERLGRAVGDDELEHDNAVLRQMGSAVSAPQYLATVDWLHAFSRRAAAWWAEGWDLLVTPVLNGPPPPIGWLSDPDAGAGRLDALMAYTSQFNMTGQPAISLPLYWDADGLPRGVQIVAGTGQEDVLVRVAAQLEEACPWASRRPAVWAG
jgi:amidase